MASVAEQVKRTAAFLDGHAAGWASKVDLDDLKKAVRFRYDDEQGPVWYAAWLAEIASRVETPEAEEAAIEAACLLEPCPAEDSPL